MANACFLVSATGLSVQDVAKQAAEPKPSTPSFLEMPRYMQSQKLVEAYFDEEAEWSRSYTQAKTIEQREMLLAKRPMLRYGARFLEFAKLRINDWGALNSLNFLVINLPDASERDEAMRLLAKHHIRNSWLDTTCQLVGRRATSDEAEPFLRAYLEHSPYRAVRASAALGLAEFLKARLEWGPAGEGTMSDEKKRESVELFQKALAEFNAMRDKKEELSTWATRIETSLRELSESPIGSSAPPIEGTGIDGAAFRLSDYRGRVVLLGFWSHFLCFKCQRMYPHERSLAKKMESRPFALLGVNHDADEKLLANVLSSEKITWRFWWEPKGMEGPIATRWRVRGWPTLFLIDAKGVIRARFEGDPGTERLDAAIERLLAEAEAGTGK